jgi:hypothetical protein
MVAVLFHEKFHSCNHKVWTHPQAFIAASRLNHADFADQAFRLRITDNLFLSSAFWTTKFHRLILPGHAHQHPCPVAQSLPASLVFFANGYRA